MRFDPKTITLLKNFASINPSMLFKPGNVVSTISPSKTVMARARVTENFPSRFAVLDLNKLINVLTMFEQHEVEFGEKALTIQAGSNRTKYYYTTEEVVISPPKDELVLPSVDVQFTLTPEMWSTLNKARAALGVSEVVVSGKDGLLELQARDTKNTTSDVFSMRIGDAAREFSVVYNVDNLLFLPQTYQISISSKGISHFKGDNLDYWIAIDATSKFN